MPKANLQLKGELYLDFHCNRKGETILADVYQAAPLKSSPALYPEDPKKAVVYLVETSGGMVSGDINHYKITTGENTHVTLLPQSSTKIYPAKEHVLTRQNMDIEVGESAFLMMLPETIIPFEHARFKNDVQLNVYENSHFIWGEILSAGRREKGEWYDYESIDSLTKINREGQLVAYDRVRLSPNTKGFHAIGNMENYTYYATLWVGSPILSSLSHEELYTHLPADSIKKGITKIDDTLLCIRWLGNDLVDIKKEITTISTCFANIVESKTE